MPELLKFPYIDKTIACLETVEQGFRSVEHGDYYFKETLCRQINHIDNLLLCDDDNFDPAYFFLVRARLTEALTWYCEATNDLDFEFPGNPTDIDEPAKKD